VAQANGAAAEALTIVVKDKMELEATTAMVNPASCCAARTACGSVLRAPFFNEPKGFRRSTRRCAGLRPCASVCPPSAIIARHFTNDQVLAEMEGLLSF
jgi:heterodisulfide reductase subunit A